MNVECTVQEVQAMLTSAQPPVLLDVRTEREWQIVHLDGARLLTQEVVDEMAAWAPATPIVCYCHHGIRSMSAAQYFKQQGFTNVCSMRGGIDSWARQIDPSLPRY